MRFIAKKTVETIIDSGNDYVIQVKGNQPTLFQAIKEAFESQQPLSSMTHDEQSRGRHERRTVSILGSPGEVADAWKGLQRVLHVERQVVREGKETLAHHYYISSLDSDDAEMFAKGIRGHWSIENRLHWVKDVIQHEDDSGIKKGNGVETLSILKNVAINISRELGFDSIKGATIHFASNVKELCEYFRT
jgi:predicted transposase YbfD/YdcC